MRKHSDTHLCALGNSVKWPGLCVFTTVRKVGLEHHFFHKLIARKIGHTQTWLENCLRTEGPVLARAHTELGGGLEATESFVGMLAALI
jgi:hypothetical protein